MSLANLTPSQISPIDVNFYLQKSLETFDKNSTDKFWSKKDKDWKVPFLMPIRIKSVRCLNLQAFMYYVQLYIGDRKAFFEQIWLFIHADIQIIVFKSLNELFFSFSDVPFPPSNKLITSEVFDPRTNKPRTDVLKQHFIVEGKIFFITFSMIRYFGPEIKFLLNRYT